MFPRGYRPVTLLLMTDPVALHRRATEAFAQRVAAIDDRQWAAPTPCSDWQVRDLVNHLVNECLWVPPLVDGQTIEQVGDKFDGDVLGDDPKGAWKLAADGAVVAVGQPGAMER